MGKLETVIELNRLEKENIKNRLEEKLRKQKYYGKIDELSDLLTKSLDVYSEIWLANGEKNFCIANKTLEALKGNDAENTFLPIILLLNFSV